MDSRGGVVLDGSVALAWGFEDESDAYAVAVTGVMGALRAYVPAIWPLEVAKTLVVGERRGRTTREKVARFLAILEGCRVVIDPETVAHAWGDTMALARAHGLSVSSLPTWNWPPASACRWPRSTSGSKPPRPSSASRSGRPRGTPDRATGPGSGWSAERPPQHVVGEYVRIAQAW